MVIMLLKVVRSETGGRVRIPGSKSHTIRALFLAGLADGESEIINPLISNDALSAVEVCKAFGADINFTENKYIVRGFNGLPQTPLDVINVGNSGTTLRFAAMTATLGEGYTVFTGDDQIRRRPMGPLLEAIINLGGLALSTRNNGMAPVIVRGRTKGGFTSVDAVTSQFLSSLLINCPLLDTDTEIKPTGLNEVPYVEMTLWWLDKQNIQYRNDDFKSIFVKGGQKYRAFKTTIPGDFSSATFFMVLAAISGGEFILENLDLCDPQGDKLVMSHLEDMGAEVKVEGNSIKIKGSRLKGRQLDLNSIPDSLPALAVAGCFASGETRLVNVPQARLKETDRIKVMCAELRKLGADITELPDGLVIKQSKLAGCQVSGHNDHRVVMALAIVGLCIRGETLIDTAEAANVTFPEFFDLIKSCGGKLKLIE
jgi:3-phosphoshikimate 1-carboxyvinyltransferase